MERDFKKNKNTTSSHVYKPGSAIKDGFSRKKYNPEKARRNEIKMDNESEMREKSRLEKRKSTRNIVIYLLMVFTTAILSAIFIINAANDVFAFVKKPEHIATISVEEKEKVSSIAKKLKDEKIINSPFVFKIYASLKKFKKDDVDAGTYELNSSMGYSQIFRLLKGKTSTKRETTWVTIPEGTEVERIAEILESKGVCKAADFLDVAANREFNVQVYPFLDKVPMGETSRLEGFLFPDSYEMYINENPSSVIRRMMDNFNSKIDDDIAERATKLKMTLRQVITLASIVEKEAASNSEFTKVSSVFHNRLNSKDYKKLQSCATIEYILPVRKDVLSIEDTKIINSYNTYMYEGLPPGPICNPGMDAIEAALYPDDTKYYFFVANGEESIFSATYSEHQAAIKRSKSKKGVDTLVS